MENKSQTQYRTPFDKKAGIVGLLASFTPEIFASEYFRLIISGIIAELAASPYELHLALVREHELSGDPDKIFENHNWDGLLLLTWRLHARFLEKFGQAGRTVPLVAVNDYIPEMNANIIYSDALEGMKVLMRYLLNRGYRRIGMLQAPTEDSVDAVERERVFRKILAEQGLELNPDHFIKCEYYFEEDGYIKTMEMIHRSRNLPRALVCFNDDLAVGALRAFREEKILVPQEVAVVGFDGTERAKFVHPPLTTVSQPLAQMGREMVRTLIGLIRGQLKPPVQIRFEPQLIVRQSA